MSERRQQQRRPPARRPGRFTVGIRLWQLGTLAPLSMPLRTVSLPLMEDLHTALNQHVQLAVREGKHAVIIERLSGSQAVRVVSQPLPRPGKVVGAPVNYLDLRAEMSSSTSIADLGGFLKAPSSVIGHRGTVQLPYRDVRTDHEGELTVVIGRTARHVSVEKALDYVFGYTCGLDMTVRSTEDRSTRKSFDTFTPLGPVVVTADEISSPGELELTCRVNGEVRQHVSTAELIFGIPELIAYTSSVMTQWPGDVILTGTPAGVGPVRDGDVVEVEISGIGTLSVDVSAATAVDYGRRPGAAQPASPGAGA